MKENRKAPEIRFPEFNDDWEQRKVSEIADRYDNLRVPVAANLRVPGNTPYYGANGIQDYVEGYTHDGEYILVAEDGASDLKNYPVKYVNGRIWVNNHAHVLQGKNNIANNRFLSYAMSLADIESVLVGGGRAKLNADIMMNLNICLPSYEEQTKIGTYFQSLDNLITLHQRKCDKIKKLKSCMLQKMFPKNGEKAPEIRFPGFTDDWEQRKFGELYEVNNERNKDLIGYDKTFSIATMTYKGEGNGAADSSLSNYKVLRIGDIAFEGHTNKEFRYGRFVANDIGDGIMSPRFSALRPLFQMPVSFWKYYIHFEPIMKRKLICSTKAGTMMNELVTADFFEQSILVPSIDEQTKIGEFLSSLDHLITLHQRKCDELKELKKGMLQKMFV